MTQAHIFYSGSVQGVGFRYTAHRYATEIGLCGWVRNLHDGRVEILAEGEKQALEDFIRKVDDSFEGYIQHKEVTYHPADARIKGFSIAATA